MTDHGARFSGRVADYVQSRPGYPDALLPALQESVGLNSSHIIADLGSGTGILTAMLLGHGCTVWAVEPNPEMLAAAEERFAGVEGFHTMHGAAEKTRLPNHSVDGVIAAQAFHWFDPVGARQEALRILKPGGYAALIWNVRTPEATPFDRAYEAFLREHGTDYDAVHERMEDSTAVAAFFGREIVPQRLENSQQLDLLGLYSRLASCSYLPAAGTPGHEQMRSATPALFAEHACAGVVTLHYATLIYAASLLECEDPGA